MRLVPGLLLSACVGAAVAQQNPVPLSAWATPQGAARIFVQACVQTSAEEGAAVDWALGQGFEPVDPARGSMDGLLAGQPGSVLAAPGTRGQVLLAAATGRQCTVWAEQMPGPPVRTAMQEALGQLSSRGAKVQLGVDRNFERAGAWRNQLQWRYRAVGASGDLGIGAITTLGDAPGTQGLNVAPLPATPAFAPDGLPVR
jgi:hypothetical protein